MTEPTPDFALLQLFVIVVGVAGVVGSAVVHGRHEPMKGPLNCQSAMPPKRRREHSRYARIQAAGLFVSRGWLATRSRWNGCQQRWEEPVTQARRIASPA
jgi:hypothetical protein